MTVQPFIQIGGRTPLSYIIKRLADHVARAVREE